MYTKIAVLYFVTYVIALPILCRNLPHSMYFRYDDTTARSGHLNTAIDENQRRLAVAGEYLRRNGPHARVFSRLKRVVQKRIQPQIVITVVTVARQPRDGLPEPRYLTQAVTRFAQLLEREDANIVFQVCNVNFPPESHNEAVFLSRYVPVVHRESTGEQAEEEDRFEKEKIDYIFCLEKSVELNPQYVLMVEDDALPTPDMLHVLRHILQYRLKSKMRQGELVHNNDDWAFMKLYSLEKWQGYGNDATSLLELIGAGLLGGTTFLIILQTRRQKIERRLVIFVLGFLYVVLLCWALGRQYLLEVRRLSAQLYIVTSAPFCCTPAVLYPVKMAAEIAAFLQTGTCEEMYPLDFALSDYALDKGLTRYLVEPNLFQHIGLVSSVRSNLRDPLE